MFISPPVKPEGITKFLKPYICTLQTSQVWNLQGTDVTAAAKIGKILGERLLLKDIPAVAVFLKRDQKYHGKVKAVINSLREAGIKLV
ncbi:hypothetical protein CsSME_00010708 [Camellia sinensis var. sinensis]